MDVYSTLMRALEKEYSTVRQLKISSRSEVSVVCHRASGAWYVYRHFEGSSEAYKKLLAVSCPHLPQIMEVGELDGKTVVLEEYVRGDTLAFLLEGKLFAPAEAKWIMMHVCEALWVLHSMGIVHRDVKPENVMIRGDEAILIDFDASRVYKSENESDTQILGTTGYAAPEQYGLSQSDERADIYALGVLLNIMLTGKHPSKELAKGRMGRIVQKCTRINPQKRFKNIIHLMEAL